MFKNFFQKSKAPILKNQIELCVSNRLYDSKEIDELLERDDVSIIEVGCNSRCEICDCKFYAIVNGEILSADNATGLITLIDAELEENSVM